MNKFTVLSLVACLSLLAAKASHSQDTTFTITADGKVGIGLTMPKTHLHVKGDFLIDTEKGVFIFQHMGMKKGWAFSTKIAGEILQLGPADNLMTQSPIFYFHRKGLGIGRYDTSAALSVKGNINVTGWVDSVDVSELQNEVRKHRARYWAFTDLNEGAGNVGDNWTPLPVNSALNLIQKKYDETRIEVFVHTRIAVASITGSGVVFQVRLSGKEAKWQTFGSLISAPGDEYVSFTAVFDDLPAGNYNVEIWAKAVPAGETATGITVDPAGFRGGILVKETY